MQIPIQRPSTPPYQPETIDDPSWVATDDSPRPREGLFAPSNRFPPRPPSPHCQSAFRHREITAWAEVDWSFLKDARDIFTENTLGALRIRVSVRVQVRDVHERVQQGRIGWLAGCSDNREIAYVCFQPDGNVYSVPFKYLSNGPGFSNGKRVVIVQDIPGYNLIGRSGFFVKRGKRVALSRSIHFDGAFADMLPEDYATQKNTLALFDA
jgi:hypothetical protein